MEGWKENRRKVVLRYVDVIDILFVLVVVSVWLGFEVMGEKMGGRRILFTKQPNNNTGEECTVQNKAIRPTKGIPLRAFYVVLVHNPNSGSKTNVDHEDYNTVARLQNDVT